MREALALSHPTRVPETSLEAPAAPQLVSLGWAVRRAALWFLMLFAMVVVGMWLFYASIDPDEASAEPSSNQAASQR
jgi:hypothetical protein